MAAAAAIVVAAVSCGPNGKLSSDDSIVLSLSVPKTEVGASSGSQFIKLTAGGMWTLSADASWLSLDEVSGSGSKSGITMKWEENTSSEPRKCTLELVSGTESVTETISQASGSSSPSQGPSGLKSDPVADWMELPSFEEGKGLYFITHDMEVGSYKGRNYSFAFDPEAKIALWVAYPLNKGLIGNGSRTNAWGLDPKVPSDCQPVIFSGFRGGYERGHQIPSADRLSANTTTFYGTNITPQKGELNEHAWASLEGYVRNWANSFDTLYVVTGADIKGSTEYGYDNNGKSVTVPTGYFKALLGYKKSGTVGISGTTGGYTGIAFYFEHKGYSDGDVMNQSMTIDALESKMGYDFFPGLVKKLGQEKADKVESTRDSWWK